MKSGPMRILLLDADASVRCALRRQVRDVVRVPVEFTSVVTLAEATANLVSEPFAIVFASADGEGAGEVRLANELLRHAQGAAVCLYGTAASGEAPGAISHWRSCRQTPPSEVLVREMLTEAQRAWGLVEGAKPAGATLASDGAFEALLEATSEGVILINEGRRIVRINDRAAECLGRKAAALIGEPFVHSFTDGASQRVVMRDTAAGPCRDVVVRATRLGGQGGTLLVLRPERSAEAGGREAELHLRDVQRMESMGKLAASLAQDWNNLLTVILGRCELVTYRVGSDETLARNLQLIQMGARRASALTRQFLSVTERQSAPDGPTDLGALLHALLPVVEVTVGSHIQVSLDVDENVGQVRLSTGHVEQVITNLALNAREAMPSGGELSIEAKRTDLSEAEARRHPAAQPGAYVCLSVTDTGGGIPTEVRGHVFEPFYTTKDGMEAHGLGLTTVRGIVQDGGGAVWIYSEEKLGTVVKAFLPVAGALPVTRELSPATGAAVGPSTILLVEDEADVRGLVREVLETAGHGVIEARTGEEGYRIARDLDEPLDLILSDVIMPQRTGPDMVAALREEGVTTRVLYMSGYTSRDIVRRGMLSEDAPYLAKPFTPDVLVRAVREALGSQTIA